MKPVSDLQVSSDVAVNPCIVNFWSSFIYTTHDALLLQLPIWLKGLQLALDLLAQGSQR